MLLDWVHSRLEELPFFKKSELEEAPQYKKSQRWAMPAALEVGSCYTGSSLPRGLAI